MGVINKPLRLLACKEQKLLWQLHCKEICITRTDRSNEPCDGCPIYEKLLKIGEIFNSTVRERIEVEE